MADMALKGQQLDLYKQHSRLYGAMADEAQGKAKRAEVLAQTLTDSSQRLQALPDALSQGRELFNIATSTGNLTEARQTLHVTGQITHELAQAANQRASALKTLREASDAQFEAVAAIHRNSKDQDSFDRNNELYRLRTGQESPLAGLPYDKDLIESAINSTIKPKDALQAELHRQDEAGRERARVATERYQRDRIRLGEEENDRRVEADRVKEKNGGKVAAYPPPGEIDAASRIVAHDYPSLDPKQLREAATTIASRARELRGPGGNRAIGAEAAIRRAYAEAKDGGQFEEAPLLSIPGTSMGVGTKVSFTGNGTAAASPLDLPTGDLSTVRKALKKGRYYRTSKGPAKWNGEGFDNPVTLEEGGD